MEKGAADVASRVLGTASGKDARPTDGDGADATSRGTCLACP